MVDYELLGIRAAKAKSDQTAPVYIRFKNVGTVEGWAWAEVYVNDQKQDDKWVIDPVGDGPGKDSLLVEYDGTGTYTVRVELTSDTGTDVLTKVVRIRK